VEGKRIGDDGVTLDWQKKNGLENLIHVNNLASFKPLKLSYIIALLAFYYQHVNVPSNQRV
jgi:hypothetical protein